MLAFKCLFVSLLLSCASGPDEFNIGYGHTFAGDSDLEGWPIDNEDSDSVFLGFTWKLRPTRVEVVNPSAPVVEWTFGVVKQDPTPQEPEQVVAPAVEDPDHSALDHVDVEAAIETYNKLDWVTRVALLGAVCWLGWVYRDRLGRLIPGGKNGADKQKKK
jgi:hypothetical protein